MAIEPVSKLMATVGWDGVDPGFSYQFLEEDGGTAKVEDYVKAGWAENDAKTYTHAYHETFYRRDDAALSAHPRLVRILGHPGQEPVGGDERRQGGQQALDDTATSWEQVTDRIGRDKQKGLSGGDRLQGLSGPAYLSPSA